MSRLEEALNYDPLSHAEKITGKDSANDTGTVFLGMGLMHEKRQQLNVLLAENDDTNSWGQTRQEWEAVIFRMGFELIYTEDIEDGQGNKLRVYWMPGLLLKSDSYSGDKSVNAATCFYNYKGPREAIDRGSNGLIEYQDEVPVWQGDHDAREGLRLRLDKMRAAGEILPTWIKRPFHWIAHYEDFKQEDRNMKHEERVAPVKAKSRQRIKKFPLHVRQAIGE